MHGGIENIAHGSKADAEHFRPLLALDSVFVFAPGNDLLKVDMSVDSVLQMSSFTDPTVVSGTTDTYRARATNATGNAGYAAWQCFDAAAITCGSTIAVHNADKHRHERETVPGGRLWRQKPRGSRSAG
ncbi:hypothetical protein SBA4_4370001 [Candidatus Sulfopaludibacter sp. SbA4]|nr:hypothetical protein SBA4_4370001 [Candidatus Sulfopaludibacter sp. SbA4]